MRCVLFPLHREPRHLRGSIRRRSIVHDVTIVIAPDCLRINVASFPNYHRALERSTMVTKAKGNRSKTKKQKKKPVKKKPAIKSTVKEMSATKTQNSQTVRHIPTQPSTEDNELLHIMMMIVASFTPFLEHGAGAPIRRVAIEARSRYLRLLHERGLIGRPYRCDCCMFKKVIYIPETDIFIGIMEIMLSRNWRKSLGLEPLSKEVRRYYRWGKKRLSESGMTEWQRHKEAADELGLRLEWEPLRGVV